MDLMTLAAKIVLDDSSYTKGISNAEKAGAGLTQKMSAMTVAVGNIAADMIRKATASIGQVISGAVDGYANYQQLIGGVETLFGRSADKVADYAKQSFKTTGLSANDYMETVTSFSASLLQGLHGDTNAAADLANTAITDMADNANKMGTDIGMIQNAYQGFAKQNYTMLDNLKLGYGGTQSEMVRLVNDSKILDHEIENLDGITFDQLVQAIHEIQTQMGITGTTAKEAAETISGSRASLDAAWTDFLTSVGGEKDQAKLEKAAANFKESFKTYVVNNLMPAMTTTLENTPELIEAISGAITDLPSKAVSDLASKGVDILTTGVNAASDIGGWLVKGIAGIFDDAKANPQKVQQLGGAIGSFIANAIKNLITYAPTILGGILQVGIDLAGSLVDGLTKGLFGENNEVQKVVDEMNATIAGVNVDAMKSQSILDYMQSIAEKYGSAATNTTEWKTAMEELDKVMPDAGKTIQGYGSNIQGAIDKLKEMSRQMRITAIMDAMNDAQQAQYRLLGEQTIQRAQSQTRLDIAQQTVDNAVPTLVSNLQAYAQEMMSLNPDMSDEMLQYYSNLAQGKDMQGIGLENYSIDQLLSQLIQVGSALESQYGDEDTRIWDQSREDQIFSYEELQGVKTSIAEAQQVIKDETALQEELGKQIEATEKEIKTTELTIQRTAQDIAYGGDQAATNITTGGTKIGTALLNTAAAIDSIRFPRFAGYTGVSYTPEATGINSVPYNGFRAELHRGEMVLTKRQAENFRNGAGTAEVVGAIQEMRADLQNMKLVVGQKTFGRAVVDYGAQRTREYIGAADSRKYAGYGT